MTHRTTLLARVSRLFQEADAHSGVAFDKPRSDAIAEAIGELCASDIEAEKPKFRCPIGQLGNGCYHRDDGTCQWNHCPLAEGWEIVEAEASDKDKMPIDRATVLARIRNAVGRQTFQAWELVESQITEATNGALDPTALLYVRQIINTVRCRPDATLDWRNACTEVENKIRFEMGDLAVE